MSVSYPSVILNSGFKQPSAVPSVSDGYGGKFHAPDGILLDAGVKGIVCFGVGMALRDGNREYYYRALDRHFPGLRGGYRETYGNAYHIVSVNHARLMAKFHSLCERYGILRDPDACFNWMRKMPDNNAQISLFSNTKCVGCSPNRSL